MKSNNKTKTADSKNKKQHQNTKQDYNLSS